MIKLYVGYDPREACVYHTFCQSVIDHASGPVSFIPLHSDMLNHFDGQQDGTNAFIYSRYLVPYLQDYKGHAIFCDGDMVVTDDIYELYSWIDPDKAVSVVKHDYQSTHPRKFIGTPMENMNVDYPRKNWSSVMLWNCEHPANKFLTTQLVAEAGPVFLHRFHWLEDDEIGELPKEWNHLVGEYKDEPAKLYHYTLGAPPFKEYRLCDKSKIWNSYLLNALEMIGERPSEFVREARWHYDVERRNATHITQYGKAS